MVNSTYYMMVRRESGPWVEGLLVASVTRDVSAEGCLGTTISSALEVGAP